MNFWNHILNIFIEDKPHKIQFISQPKIIAQIKEIKDNFEYIYTWEYTVWKLKRTNWAIETPYTEEQVCKIIYQCCENIGYIEFKFEKIYGGKKIRLKVFDNLLNTPLLIDFRLTNHRKLETEEIVNCYNGLLETKQKNKWKNLSDLFTLQQNQSLSSNDCQIKKGKDNIIYMRGNIINSKPCLNRFGPLPVKYRPLKKVCFKNECELNQDGTLWLYSEGCISFNDCYYFID